METTPLPDIKLLLTVEEAAQVLSLSRSLMYNLVLTKRVKSMKVNRARRIPLSALREYIEQEMAVN